MTTAGTIASTNTWQTMKAQGWLDAVTYTSSGTNPGTSPSETDLLDEGIVPTTTDYSVYMRVTRFRQEDLRRVFAQVKVKQGDRMARIPKAQLTPTPTDRDTITINGTAWDIVDINERVDEAEWQFIIRRASGAQASA